MVFIHFTGVCMHFLTGCFGEPMSLCRPPGPSKACGFTALVSQHNGPWVQQPHEEKATPAQSHTKEHNSFQDPRRFGLPRVAAITHWRTTGVSAAGGRDTPDLESDGADQLHRDGGRSRRGRAPLHHRHPQVRRPLPPQRAPAPAVAGGGHSLRRVQVSCLWCPAPAPYLFAWLCSFYYLPCYLDEMRG